MLFNEIIIHDFKRPLRERLAARKYVGPYRWRPQEPGKGRGFYQARKGGLRMDRAGSSFELRLVEANDELPDSRLSWITGYYCDAYGDETLTPIVARLPGGRGFLAGWTMGAGMCASLDADIYSDAEDAARAAHDTAERDAERMREEQEDYLKD